MKKITFFTVVVMLVFLIANTATAQNLALNPGFEDWTVNGAPGPADNWTLSGSDMTGAQETTNVRTGTYSTNITWTTTSTRYLQQFVAVTAGSNYNFSFWALDNEPGGRARVTIRWYDSGGSFISGYYGDYTSDNASWQQVTSGSQTAPAGAVEAHIEIRVYDVSAGWTGSATVYVDDAEFTQITTLEISKAYAISETAVDVQYSAAVTSVSAGDYSLTGAAAITFSGATIDGTDNTIVHLTGASTNMAGDITVDNLADAANSDNYDFYAGIMPIAFTNENNPGGVMNGTEIASFSGIISANDEYNNVWISDAAGERNGVMIYSSSFDALVDVGDDILMIGKRDTYNNLNEIVSPELITTNSTGNSPYGPDIIPGSDIDETLAADTDPGEKWEGQLVTIENFTVDSYVDYDYTCSWSDGTTTYYFHVGDNVDYHLNNITLNVGETYGSITGVVDWYNSGPYYRINPRSQSDIVAGAAAARIVGSIDFENKKILSKENQSSNLPFCPINLGVCFLDQVRTLENFKRCKFSEIIYPILLLPFLSRGSEVIGKRILLKFDDNQFLLNFNVSIYSNFSNEQYPVTARDVEVTFLENKDNFTDLEWKNLYKLSEETFVEETDSLKKEAAGAGLTDND